MRYFNTAGPCDLRFHYMVDPLARLPEARPLAERGFYFVVHAPRQTGKTTCLRTLARALCAEGRLAALHFSCEAAKAAGDDYSAAQGAVLSEICTQAESYLPDELQPPPWPPSDPAARIRTALKAWARACPRPLVLFFDEIDAVTGASLLSILGQLRAGYDDRPDAAPWSVVLCGLRDVRDYKAASGGDASRTGSSSPFNIKVKSLRLGNLSEPDVRTLLGQRTEETGQAFAEEALIRLWELTRGQPWLVNALGREVTEEIGVPPSAPITAAHVEEAKERLILARQTHLDSLVARLHEPRVKRIIGPLLSGRLARTIEPTYDDDHAYVRDLGIIADDKPTQVANPIYREVIVRVLGGPVEDHIDLEPRSFVLADGTLDLDRILRDFIGFWCEHGEILASGLPYHEVAPQLVLMAYLQRIVNGGGFIDREYGVGRGRIDLLVRWPYRDAGCDRQVQREALELKVWAEGRPDPTPRGLQQLDAYLDRLGLDTGVLVVFDRRPAAPPVDERTRLGPIQSPAGRPVTLLRA